MKRLRQKLGSHGSLVETVRGVGYRVAKAAE
jgi:DNA-binding response OmpR family regulator